MPAKTMPPSKIAPAPTPRGAALLARRRAAAELEIEKAALTFLGEHDPASVTVEQIATAAGISRRTFYRYFETTDDIIAAMPRRFMRRVTQAFRARPPEESILDAFLAAIRKAASVDTSEEIEIHRLTARVRRRAPEAWSRAIRRLQAHEAEVLEQIVAERLRARGKDAAAAGAIAATFMALLVNVPRQSERKGEPATAETLERAFRSLVEMLTTSGAKRTRASPRKRAK